MRATDLQLVNCKNCKLTVVILWYNCNNQTFSRIIKVCCLYNNWGEEKFLQIAYFLTFSQLVCHKITEKLVMTNCLHLLCVKMCVLTLQNGFGWRLIPLVFIRQKSDLQVRNNSELIYWFSMMFAKKSRVNLQSSFLLDFWITFELCWIID